MAENNGTRIPGRTVKLIEIELDRPRKMLFDFNALMAAEDALNDHRKIAPDKKISIEKLIVAAAQQDSLPHDVTLFLLWSSLLFEDPTLKPETVRKMNIDRRVVIPKLLEAIAAAWPQPKGDQVDKEVGDADRPLAPTDGSASGPSGG